MSTVCPSCSNQLVSAYSSGMLRVTRLRFVGVCAGCGQTVAVDVQRSTT